MREDEELIEVLSKSIGNCRNFQFFLNIFIIREKTLDEYDIFI
jgi:hypothetical protein